MSVNKAILVGNVGKDPEVRYLEGGTAVANFPLATSEVYKNRNGDKVTQTEWHNIVAWRGLAELAEKYITKGRQLYVEGRITTRSWEDKDGNKRYTTEIVANSIQLLGRRDDDSNGGQEDNSSSENTAGKKADDPELNEEPMEEDDLPF
jgi:single-strand DNA-binding protein